ANPLPTKGISSWQLRKKTPAKKAAAPAKKAAPATKAAPAKKAAAPAKKVAAKAPAKKAAPATKRTPNPAFMKALTPSAALAAVVGATPTATHRSGQQDVGLHQEAQAARQRQPPRHQCRRQAQGCVWQAPGHHVRNGW
ncbi:Uncharacterized protein APZ42_005952, partial [Daphnia magna]